MSIREFDQQEGEEFGNQFSWDSSGVEQNGFPSESRGHTRPRGALKSNQINRNHGREGKPEIVFNLYFLSLSFGFIWLFSFTLPLIYISVIFLFTLLHFEFQDFRFFKFPVIFFFYISPLAFFKGWIPRGGFTEAPVDRRPSLRKGSSTRWLGWIGSSSAAHTFDDDHLKALTL